MDMKQARSYVFLIAEHNQLKWKKWILWHLFPSQKESSLKIQKHSPRTNIKPSLEHPKPKFSQNYTSIDPR